MRIVGVVSKLYLFVKTLIVYVANISDAVVGAVNTRFTGYHTPLVILVIFTVSCEPVGSAANAVLIALHRMVAFV